MRATGIIVLLVLVVLPALSFASDWPRFRGPNGSGVSSDTNLPAEIGPGKNLFWKIATPKGNSSPVVAGGRIFLTGWEGETRFILGYDAKSGKELWRRTVPRKSPEQPNPINGYTTPSVATGEGSVFAFIPEFGLAAFDAATGNELWTSPAAGPYGGVQGMAVSPIYLEGRIYLLIDTPEQAWLGAYNASNGKREWKAERSIGFLGGYSTPAVHRTAQGRNLIVAAGALETVAYDAKTGERVWWAKGLGAYPAAPALISADSLYTVEPYGDGGGAPPWTEQTSKFDADNDNVIDLREVTGDTPGTAIWRRILTSIDRNTGNNDGKVTEEEFTAGFVPPKGAGGLVRARLDGKGDATKSAVVWRYTKGVPYVTAPLLYKNVLWVVRNGGIVLALEPSTGKVLKESRLKDALGEYYAQPVGAENRIYYVSRDGKVTITTATPEWEIVASADLAEDVIATPAIADSRLFIRTSKSLWCFAKG